MMLKLDYVPSRCHAVKNVIRGQIEVWMQFRFYHRKLPVLSANLTHTASPSAEWVIQPEYCFMPNGPCFSIVITGNFREQFVWWQIHFHKASILPLLHTDDSGTWCFVIGIDRVSWRPLCGFHPWHLFSCFPTIQSFQSQEGNGNPLQCSCLENPSDGGAWWAAIYGVAQSQTRLKQLSSSSSHVSMHWGLPSLSYSKIIPLFLVPSPSCLPHQHPVPLGCTSLPSWLPFLSCFITLELQVLEGMWNIHMYQSDNFRSFGIKFHLCSNTLE